MIDSVNHSSQLNRGMPARKPSIGQDLGAFASQLANIVQQGENAAMAGVAGTMPVQQVVQHVLEAERAVTTMVAVRDKVVNGLLELTRMQI